MHELSIALAVVEKAEEVAREHGAARVDAVRLRIGELAGVVPAALRFSFEVAREGTAAAGARLVVEEVPARARCTPCGAEFTVGTPPQLWCPACDGAPAELLAGRELQVTGVELSGGRGDCGAAEPASAVPEGPSPQSPSPQSPSPQSPAPKGPAPECLASTGPDPAVRTPPYGPVSATRR